MEGEVVRVVQESWYTREVSERRIARTRLETLERGWLVVNVGAREDVGLGCDLITCYPRR